MKKILLLLILLAFSFTLLSCNVTSIPVGDNNNTSETPNGSETPGTEGGNSETPGTEGGNTETPGTEGGNTETPGTGTEGGNSETPGTGTEGGTTETPGTGIEGGTTDMPETPIVSNLEPTTIYIVGDSTVCDYKKSDGTITDESYFYDRFGYGTQISNYFNDKVTVKNLALSGRSSKSFVSEDNYNTLKNSIAAGDYLIIGFGHNDEKSDDSERFASANEGTNVSGSFKYNLYNFYVKLAIEKGAIPIICSPIVRYSSNNNYSSSNGHITSNGDYSLACRELGEEMNVQVVDLTTLTKNLYLELENEAIYFHAMTGGLNADTPDLNTTDTTHINIYGAKMVSYLFAETIKNSNCTLKNYLKNEYIKPTKAKDLIKNSLYTYVEYNAPSVLQNSWFGTAFGDCGGSVVSTSNGYVAKEEDNKFIVGQASAKGLDTGFKGKIAQVNDGRAYMLQKISITKNVTIVADAKVVTLNTGIGSGAGFGLVIRDEAYSLSSSSNNKGFGLGNSFNAGLLSTSSNAICIFSRETKTLITSSNKANMYSVDSTAHFKIERVGQKITCIVTYEGKTYTETYIDKDLVALDHDYYYIGMFAARGTIVEFSNVVINITGESQGA